MKRSRVLLTLLAVTGLVTNTLVPNETSNEDILRCRELLIVDQNERITAKLSSTESGGYLDIFDTTSGKATKGLLFSTHGGGGGIIAFNGAGEGSVGIGQNQRGDGLVAVMSNGLGVAELQGDANGGAFMVLNDHETRDGVVRLRAGQFGNGVTEIRRFNGYRSLAK